MTGRIAAQLTIREKEILYKIFRDGLPLYVITLPFKQDELAKQLGISRQALNAHLRSLKEKGLIRTGRNFIDITENALPFIGMSGETAFVFIKVEPKFRKIAYSKILKLNILRLYRVTGEVDLIAVVDKNNLNSFLKEVTSIPGVVQTDTHIVLEVLNPRK
ncbi:MAG: Lrp/AsnC family transcriptional regulator [Candidatus Asgardarchaeia archaeon]